MTADAMGPKLDDVDILTRRSMDKDGLKKAILGKLIYSVGKDPEHATDHDWFFAAGLAVRDRMVDGWMNTTRDIYNRDRKRVYYLSLEFLIGRLLADSMRNLGILQPAREALGELGVDLDRVLEAEPDAALGNGGLGRLAACFMESMATLGIPGFGYGIRYEHGLFKQRLINGWQVEQPEDWLAFGNPWEFERSEAVYPIRFGGHVLEERTKDGKRRHIWEGGQRVLAVAYDTAVVGWQGKTINTLRLWSAQSGNLIDLESFDRGDYMQAVSDQVMSESISRVLYPNDSTEAGQVLRLKQEYFFTAASLHDIVRRHLSNHDDLRSLPDHCAIQLNDTHPALAVPELMRILIDEHDFDWYEALEITSNTIHYTNHTLMPEALERWSVQMLEGLLPRHMQLIYDLNAHFLGELRKRPDNPDPFLRDVSVIEEGYGRAVRMGHLAYLGSRKVNGVSQLHANLMKATVFRNLHEYYPDKITGITNGVTPRRWLLGCNPRLSALIDETIGDGWADDLERLNELDAKSDDADFQERFASIKKANKEDFISFLKGSETFGDVASDLNPDALFDVQIKRIHEYKRQLLNVLEAIGHYQAILDRPGFDWQPRVKIIAGKAAASYHRAKLIIKLINDAARLINNDQRIGNRLKLLFLPNYNVSLAERLIPATDLSEQISTAGMEASGTGNMKFALNGAVTIGTLDGANVEIGERVGEDNIFIFGLEADQVEALRRKGYEPRDSIARDPGLQRVLEMLEDGVLSPDDPSRFRPIVDDLRGGDHFLVTADFADYARTQRRVDTAFSDSSRWRRMAIANVARNGWFSSDRSISEYAEKIWRLDLRKH